MGLAGFVNTLNLTCTGLEGGDIKSIVDVTVACECYGSIDGGHVFFYELPNEML